LFKRSKNCARFDRDIFQSGQSSLALDSQNSYTQVGNLIPRLDMFLFIFLILIGSNLKNKIKSVNKKKLAAFR
jgi:hypothetical protein